MHQVSRRRVLQYCASLPLAAQLPLFDGSSVADAAEPKAAKPKVRPFSNYDDAVLVGGEPPKIADGSLTIAVLPDTQKYAGTNAEGFLAQTEWIVKNRKARNIAAALHLGDITDNNRPDQWDLAVKAMHKLDGHVPYFMTLGNHDYSENGACADRTTRYNEYFPKSEYEKRPTFGGTYDRESDRMENCYHTFSAAGKDFLVVVVEFGPRSDVVRWADEVVARHPRHEAILVTHAYMYNDDARYDWAKLGKEQSWNPHSYKVAAATGDDMNDGEQLWQKLVGKNSNFSFTFNGHVLGDGLGRITTSDARGRPVNQMLVNFQMRPNGGDGWMRLVEIKADRSVNICDYSPYRDQHNDAPQNRFQLKTAPLAS